MAKRINFTNNQGINFPESYWRVIRVVFDVAEKTIFINVVAHRDNQARQDGLETIAKRSFVITDSDDFNLIAAAIINKVKNPLEIGYQILNREEFFSAGEDV